VHRRETSNASMGGLGDEVPYKLHVSFCVYSGPKIPSFAT